MTTGRHSWLSRAAAVSILGVLVLLAVVLLAPIWNHTIHVAEQLSSERENLWRLQSYKARTLGQKTKAGSATDILSPSLFIQGANDALRSARLQQAVSDVIKKNGLALRATRSISLPPVAGFRRLGVEFELTVPVKALRDLLVEINQRSPELSVASLKLSAAFPNDPRRRDMIDARFAIGGIVSD